MSYMRTGVVTLSFIILFSIVATAIPSYYYVPSEYETYYIPSEFQAWIVEANTTDISAQVTKGIEKKFDFAALDGNYHSILVKWNTLDYPWDQLAFYRKTSWHDVFPSPFNEELDRDMLVASQNADNKSIHKITDSSGFLIVTIEDTNGTRNDVGAAFDGNKLNVTLSYVGVQSGVDPINAYNMIMALLTFRLPSIFSDMNPLLGGVISVIFYVPIIMFFFTTVVKSVHG